jgi:hypothetical protein
MHVLYAEVLSSRLTEVQLNQSRLTELILPRKEPESNTDLIKRSVPAGSKKSFSTNEVSLVPLTNCEKTCGKLS